MFFADLDDVFINPEVMYTFRPSHDAFEVRSMPTHTEDGIPIRKLYVSNLPPKTTRTELFGLFAPYGFIKSCWLRMEERGQNRAPISTYAFVTFSNPADAHKALIAPIHEKTLRGRRLRISPADSWHQPVEDADGRIRWKPQNQSHYEDRRSTPNQENDQENAENVPQTSQESSRLPENGSVEVPSDTEESYNILDILNRDCLHHILTYVPIRDIIQSERVSKGWQNMVQEYLEGVRVFKTSWWQHMPLPLTTAVLRRMLARLGGGLLRLHIDHHWSALNDRTAHTVGKFCPNLDEVKVVGMHTKNWNPLLYGCKQLKHLSFISCNKLTDSSLVHFVKSESCLETLTIANNNHVTGLFLTGSNPSRLSSLAFYNCYNLQGAVLCAAIDTLPHLTTLKLDVCLTTMWKIVPLILNKLPGLQELSLSEYTSTEICFMPIDGEPFCKAISNLTKLKVLNLSRNIYITNAILKQVAQSCQSLETLNISSCNSNHRNYPGISDEGVLAVCGGCTQLRELDVSYLAALSDAGLGSLARLPQLRRLTARACPALSAAPFAAAVASCAQLQELDVCGCNGVSEQLVCAAAAALELRPRALTLWLAGTAAAFPDDQGEAPSHKLLTVDAAEDRSNTHLRPDFVDSTLEDSSDDSYDDLYDDDAYDDFYGPGVYLSDEERFLDGDIDGLEGFDYNVPFFALM